jgi:hypothetical protein
LVEATNAQMNGTTTRTDHPTSTACEKTLTLLSPSFAPSLPDEPWRTGSGALASRCLVVTVIG